MTLDEQAAGDPAAFDRSRETFEAVLGWLDEYWHYHLDQERQRIHQSRYANSVIPQAA